MAMLKTKQMSELQKLSLDLYNGKVEKFSKEEGTKMICGAIREALGIEEGEKLNYYSYQENKNKLFSVLSEVLDVTVGTQVINAFERMTDVKDTNFGDIAEFLVRDGQFKVATVAAGMNNVRRQKLVGRKVPMTSSLLIIKIYEEVDALLSGRVDFAGAIDKVAEAMIREIARRIAVTFEGAYTTLNANLVVSGSMDEAKLMELIAKVEGATGKKAVVYGTKSALSKISTEIIADADRNDLRNKGFVSMFKGTECVELAQAYNPDTNEWATANDKLYVVPQDEKIIKLAFEGEAMIDETTDTNARLDRQVEYQMMKKIQIGVLTTNTYGAYVMA